MLCYPSGIGEQPGSQPEPGHQSLLLANALQWDEKLSMVVKYLDKIREIVGDAAHSLLFIPQPQRYTWAVKLWLAGLFLGGLFVFGLFFRWGNFDLNYQDWALITGPRLQVLQQAMLERQLPLNISDPATLHSATDRYLTVADISISPQYLLLLWLPIPLFNLVNVWILYTIGFAGLLVLRRKLKLALLSFSLLFLVFNFNGGILAHLSVGHESFGGYFLFPWFAWLVFRLLEGDRSWLWTALMSALLFAMWLQGSFHLVVWLLILLAGIAVFAPRTLVTVVRTGAITFLVCAFRLLPSILSYNAYRETFLNAYPSLYALWDNLVNIPVSMSSPFLANPGLGKFIAEWELANFIGLPAALVLIFFGFYQGLIKPDARYPKLLGPLAVLFLLTMVPTLKFFRLLPVPLLQGERVGSRIFCVVLVFGIILAAERFQRWLDANAFKQKGAALIVSLTGFIITAIELWQDARIWKVDNRTPNLAIEYVPSHWYLVNNYQDKVYLALVFGGLAISVLSILALAWLSWREHLMSIRLIKRP
jgi:hypothetical protein